jgi:BED zinc finger
MKSKRNQSVNINAKKSNKRLLSDFDEVQDHNADSQNESHVETDELHTDADTSTDSLARSKSNVWTYAHRHPTDHGWAVCQLCPSSPIPKRISTKGGATSTLRKHLVKKHNKIDLLLTSEGGEPVERMSSTKRNRLHQLLINAIIIDGRCFGDFRKSGFSRFLADAIPGES